MFFNYFMLTVELRRGGFALGLPRYHKRKDIVNMYQKTAINMRLAKIQAKIYDLESLAFETTEEVNQLLNEICELVAVRYREAKALEKKSHNLYSEFKDIEDEPVGKYHTIFDPGVKAIMPFTDEEPVDLTQAVAATIENIKKTKGKKK